jgi:hypothetical protein
VSTAQSSAHLASPASRPVTPRRRLLTASLVLGPSFVLVSALLNHTPVSDNAIDVLAAVRAHRGQHLAEVLLELFGLAMTLAAMAAVSLGIRERGARLASLGAAAAVLGIIGFSMVNAEGLVVNALAGMPQQSSAEQALSATTSSPAVYVAFPLIMLGELGVVAVLAACRRAQFLPTWPAVLAFASVVVDFSGGSKTLLIVSDILMLAASWWLAAGISRHALVTARLGHGAMARPRR